MKKTGNDRILLAHGGGGQLMDDLIRQHILPSLKNDALAELGRTATLSSLCSLTVAISGNSPYAVRSMTWLSPVQNLLPWHYL